MPSTSAHKLAEVLLGKPLDPWVARLRGKGLSWADIADELRRATNGEVSINRETLRLWYRDTPVEAQ